VLAVDILNLLNVIRKGQQRCALRISAICNALVISATVILTKYDTYIGVIIDSPYHISLYRIHQVAPICTSHLIRGSLSPREFAAKRYLDRFGCFCRAHGRDQHTGELTENDGPSKLQDTKLQDVKMTGKE